MDLEDDDAGGDAGEVFDFDMQDDSGETDHIATGVDEQHEFTAEFGNIAFVGNEVIVDDSVAPAPDIAIDESSADVDLTMGNHFGGRRKKKKNRAGGDEIVMVPAQHHFRVIQMFLLF